MDTLRKQQVSDALFLTWKDRTVDFMKAYQEQDVPGMLANCTANCTVAFLPLGDQGKGNVHEVGKAIWNSIIESFPTIDNTVNSVVLENGDVRCEASITGRQEKEFAGLVSQGNSFEEDHIFIFKMDDAGHIKAISVDWDHESLVQQLTAEKNPQTSRNDYIERKAILHQIASDYVTEGLGGGNFDCIPYAEQVELRAPILPGGSESPMISRSVIKENWWAPLPDLVSGTELIDTYTNSDLTGVSAEFLCHIANPKCTLRIVDRFLIDEDGKITKQENFFDPRDLTNPGWRD